MGSCTRRHFLLSICLLQMITIIERQVFDFLGYMWAPIVVNFLHILLVIFGFYGAYHFRIKYIITYLIWNFLWIGWNSFLICFYLDVGTLNKNSDLLNLGTGSVSWFEANGYGCKPIYPTNETTVPSPEDLFRPLRPERVDDCLLDYDVVEVIHSGVQCALALLGILGSILISCIFLDEDDRFDFMNGDAKSPQHTVVHPMYVSYTSIPTSASATMQSTKQQQHQQQQQQQHQQQQQQQHHNHHHHNHNDQAINNNTYLTHTHTHTSANMNATDTNNFNNIINNSYSYNKNKSNKKSKNYYNSNSLSSNSNNNNMSATTPANAASMQNTLTRMISTNSNTRTATATTATAAAAAPLTPLTPLTDFEQQQQFNDIYDDSTAKADQLYTNSNRRQQQMLPTYQQQQQQQLVATPTSSHDNTTSSLSYASLQNSNLYLAGGGGSSSIGGAVVAANSSLSNSNFSISNNNNSNTNTNTNNSAHSGRFARIHHKPKTPKSTSYSSFINAGNTGSNSNSNNGLVVSNNLPQRSDIKYTQMSSERLSRNLEEDDDDNFSLQNFKADNDVTYVPFQSPTPTNLFISKNNNNNASYTSLNSYQQQQQQQQNVVAHNNNTNNNNNSHNASPNNNSGNSANVTHAPFSILLEHGAVLQPIESAGHQQQPPILNAANRFLYQQNGLPFHPAYSPAPPRRQPPRPTNIPLPTVPLSSAEFALPISPSEVLPPPPPAPRPHIFQPRSGHAPYPDLSPEVTERYAMPTQYVPRSPVATRIARRQRLQQQQQHQQQQQQQQQQYHTPNFCDQVRDAPPGYIANGHSIVRAHSHDRLQHQQQKQQQQQQQKQCDANAAPHVNRRSGRREARARPRSYCNALAGGGEGVVRANIAGDRVDAGTTDFIV